MKFNVVLMQFKLNIPISFLGVRFIETMELNAGLLTVSSSYNVGLNSVVNESTWYKLGMMIDAVDLYIVKPV